jgi:YHS domain-containing protein
MNLRIALATLALLFISASQPLIAAERINTLEKKGLFGYKPNGIAIRGYDTVAYFTVGKPLEGKDEFTTQWSGATWKFANQEHLDLFTASPEKYAPQYGGYCAYGVAVESLVKIEPDLWHIIDDKLYLNFNQKFDNAWREDISGYIAKADSLFEKLISE